MQNLKKQNQKLLEKNHSIEKRAIDFIAAGIGCNSLLTLSESGILDKLLDGKTLRSYEINHCKNPVLIKSVLMTLVACHILELDETEIKISPFGIEVAKYLGLVSMLFDGYGNLMSNQKEIVNKYQRKPEKLIRGSSVSKAAIQLANSFIDPVVMSEFSYIRFKGTICDLGCGYGKMLSKACSVSGNPGLGFDNEPSVIRLARIQLKGTQVDVELGDICKLKGIWEDVVCLIQCHVFHDFTPNENCITLMNSFLKNFPNLKYFFYIDTVTPTLDNPDMLPGFDYVHGLLGIQTRTYKETLEMFSHSQYSVLKEVPIQGLPSTYLWLLSPKQHVQRKRA